MRSEFCPKKMPSVKMCQYKKKLNVSSQKLVLIKIGFK